MIGSATEIERNVLKGRDRRYRTAAMVAIASGRRSAKLRSGWMSRSTWSPATKEKPRSRGRGAHFRSPGGKPQRAVRHPIRGSGTPSATRSVKTATSPRVDARTTRNSGLLLSIAKTGWLTPYAHSATRCANRQRYAGSTMLAGRAGADAVAADVALTWRPPPRRMRLHLVAHGLQRGAAARGPAQAGEANGAGDVPNPVHVDGVRPVTERTFGDERDEVALSTVSERLGCRRDAAVDGDRQRPARRRSVVGESPSISDGTNSDRVRTLAKSDGWSSRTPSRSAEAPRGPRRPGRAALCGGRAGTGSVRPGRIAPRCGGRSRARRPRPPPRRSRPGRSLRPR